jgi:hypothetical protein
LVPDDLSVFDAHCGQDLAEALPHVNEGVSGGHCHSNGYWLKDALALLQETRPLKSEVYLMSRSPRDHSECLSILLIACPQHQQLQKTRVLPCHHADVVFCDTVGL